jgi:hypothetical protein
VDLAKLFAKLPGVVFDYPECFIGLFSLVLGLPKGVEPGNSYIPFGFALIGVSMVRRNLFHVGFWRSPDDGYKRHFVFREFFVAIFWAAVSWGCFRWSALDVHIDQTWVRRILHY